MDEIPSAPNGEPDSSTPAVAPSEPNTLPLTFCRVCQAEVKPEGKGKCPRCGTFLRLNFVARRGPVNVLRRDALLAELVAEYRPPTVGLRSTCEQYAATLERLENTKPGSTEWQRLIQIAQLLGVALEESRASRVALPPTDYAGLSAAQFADRAEAMAREARRLADAEAEGAAIVSRATAEHRASSREIPDEETTHASTAVEPAQPPPRCAFCGQAPCIGPEHTAFSALHYNDPEEIKKRDEIATKEMYESLRRYGVYRY